MEEPKTMFEKIVEKSYKAKNHNGDEIVINSSVVIDIVRREYAKKKNVENLIS